VVDAYRTVPAPLTAEERTAAAGADIATFTSSSTVERFLELLGPEAVPPAVACIGPITADTARANGLTVDVEASEHTISGLVAALTNWARAHPDPRQ
ncbi:MAG TPA: uroporphyrinogen-III synthase, partial [Acidimicrobiales bacterium]